MKKQNLIDLLPGENRILIEGSDLGVFKGKFPIFRAPENTLIHNMHIEILSPFLISIGNSPDELANSRLDFELGTANDDDYFITRVQGDKVGIQNACSGEYFKTSLLFKVPTTIYLNVFSLNKPWFISENLNVTRYAGGAGSSNFDTAITYGGTVRTTEVYEHHVWSISNSMTCLRSYFGGCGGTSNSLAFAGTVSGSNTTSSEKFDGISWSTSANVNAARRFVVGVGNSSSALGFGGRNDLGGQNIFYSMSEEFNGLTWIQGTDCNTERERHSGCGSVINALSFGGRCYSSIKPYVDFCETYNGTSWFIGADLIRLKYGGSGCGVPSSALHIGGYLAVEPKTRVEEYNGTLWFVSNDINEGRGYLMSGSYSGFAMSIGGYNETIGSGLNTTEKMMAIPLLNVKSFGTMIVNTTIL